jgi:hypothetical protein
MQRATCTGIRIRSPSDARTIFHAVRGGILPMVTRRLDTEERSLISPGSVYVWEERGPHAELTGVSRWIRPKANVRSSTFRLESKDGQMVNSFSFHRSHMGLIFLCRNTLGSLKSTRSTCSVMCLYLDTHRSKGFLFYHEKQTPQHMYSEYEVAGPSVLLALKFAW